MSEHENDGLYWEPTSDDDLRQGDLLFNVPIALMPQHPRFMFGAGEEVVTQTYADYPDNPPSDDIVVEGAVRRPGHDRHAYVPRLAGREGRRHRLGCAS